MNKAILVMDMPDSCKNCMCYVLGANNDFCHVTKLVISDNTTKANHCPLKPSPERIDIPDFDHSIKAESDNAWDVGAYMYSRGQLYGWNYCLNRILDE
jgi:hypothetical protein